MVHPDAERVENGVGDGGSCRAMSGLTGTERIQISALNQFDIDLRHLARLKRRIGYPVQLVEVMRRRSKRTRSFSPQAMHANGGAYLGA